MPRSKAESQIAKLKKKQQELEDLQANKHGMSDTNEEEEEEERPKNQSIAQIIYADNRVRICFHCLPTIHVGNVR